MSHITNGVFEGSYTASGTLTDENGAWSVVSSGTINVTLSHNADGSVTGTWTYSGQATSSNPDVGTFNDSISDSGTLSGTSGSIKFTAGPDPKVVFSGTLDDSGELVTGTATATVAGFTGSVKASVSLDFSFEPVDTSDITFAVVAPDIVQWQPGPDAFSDLVFVSPQFTVDEETGEWYLTSTGPDGGGANASVLKYVIGEGLNKLANKAGDAAKDIIADTIEDELGPDYASGLGQILTTVEFAQDYYAAVEKLARGTMQIVVDTPEVFIGLRSPGEIEERIEAVQNQFVEDLSGMLFPDYVLDAVKGINWFLRRSDYEFGLQEGGTPYFGADHRDVFLGGILNDDFSGGTSDDIGFGMAGADLMSGGEGNDQLFGGDGNDDLFGEEGDDTIAGGSGSDVIYGGDGNATLGNGDGNDSLDFSGNDTLKGGGGIDGLFGEDGDDVLKGGGGSDGIFGGDGNDVLNGGPGPDVLIGGSGADIFAFADRLGKGNVDVIVDFTSTEDMIRLDDDVFRNLATDVGDNLLAGEFTANATGTATDANDRILYNQTNGALFYDADGSGPIARIKFATLEDAPQLDADDLIVVG